MLLSRLIGFENLGQFESFLLPNSENNLIKSTKKIEDTFFCIIAFYENTFDQQPKVLGRENINTPG